MKFHIGSVTDKPVKFVPILFIIISDTKEANDIVGIRGAPSCKMRCRMCTSTNLLSTSYLNADLRRTDEVIEIQQRRGQEAWIEYVRGNPLNMTRKHSLE
jgi:hypothetical protein